MAVQGRLIPKSTRIHAKWRRMAATGGARALPVSAALNENLQPATRPSQWRVSVTPTKLLVGQILIVFAVMLGGIWFATHWPAAEPEWTSGVGTPNRHCEWPQVGLCRFTG